MLGHIPRTWVSTPLDCLSLLVLGGDWGKSANFEDNDYVLVRCIRASELGNWGSDRGSSAALRKIKRSSLAARELKSGDIIVEVSGGGPEQPVGRNALIDSTVLATDPERPKVCTNFFRLLRPAREMNSAFLNFFLSYFYSTGRITAYQAGSNNIRNLRFKDYLTIPIPIPPSSEQNRIVAKIEELFSELDNGTKILKDVRAQLVSYRQAILKHAFEGKLTTRWREKNEDTLETPEQLIARVKKQRSVRYEKQLQDWKTAVEAWEKREGRGSAKPKRPREVSIDLTKCEGDTRSPLPYGWRWVRLSCVAEVSGGLTKNPKRDKLQHKMKYLRVANVYADRILTDDIHMIGVTGNEASSVILEHGDLLLVEGNGSIEQIGRVAMWQSELHDCGHQNHLIRVRMATEHDPRFVLRFLLSPRGRELLTRAASSTSGLHTLSISKVENIPVPVASISEELEVVCQIDHELSVVDKAVEEINNRLEESRILRQSIFKRAFSGRLVSQDAMDEPASVLLERIDAERDLFMKRTKIRKTRKPEKTKVTA